MNYQAWLIKGRSWKRGVEETSEVLLALGATFPYAKLQKSAIIISSSDPLPTPFPLSCSIIFSQDYAIYSVVVCNKFASGKTSASTCRHHYLVFDRKQKQPTTLAWPPRRERRRCSRPARLTQALPRHGAPYHPHTSREPWVCNPLGGAKDRA